MSINVRRIQQNKASSMVWDKIMQLLKKGRIEKSIHIWAVQNLSVNVFEVKEEKVPYDTTLNGI